MNDIIERWFIQHFCGTINSTEIFNKCLAAKADLIERLKVTESVVPEVVEEVETQEKYKTSEENTDKEE